jgi:hypothetical protein
MRAVMVFVVVVLVGGLVVQRIQYSRVAAENKALRQEIAELQSGGQALQGTSGRASTISEAEHVALLRLRNQAAQLRRATNELAELRAQVERMRRKGSGEAGVVSIEAPGLEVPREAWTFAGYATPEAGYQSAMFAVSQRDEQMILGSLTPEEAEKLKKDLKEKTLDQLLKEGNPWEKVTSFRVLERKEVGPERVMLVIYAGGEEKVTRMLMQKVGGEWKVAGPANRQGERD